MWMFNQHYMMSLTERMASPTVELLTPGPGRPAFTLACFACPTVTYGKSFVHPVPLLSMSLLEVLRLGWGVFVCFIVCLF